MNKNVLRLLCLSICGWMTSTLTTAVAQTAFNGTPSEIPGKIEAENFDEGGEGVAYHDADEENREAGARLDEGVDVKSEGGRTCIGWTQEGEWLAYTVDVKETSQFKYTLFAATDNNSASFHFEIDGEKISSTKTVGSTGDWSTYKEVTGTTKEISAGKHVLKLVIDGSYFDVDWFSFEPYFELKTVNFFKDGKVVYANEELMDSIYIRGGSTYASKNNQICYSVEGILDSVVFNVKTTGENGLVTDDYVYDANISYRDINVNPCSQQGTIVKETYGIGNGTNTCYVYLPYGYDSSKKYNIFYLMHGGGEDENTLFISKSSGTEIQNVFDHLIQDGTIEPTIVVTPTFNKCSAETFWQELRQYLLAYIEGKYSTYAEGTTIDDFKKSRMHRAYGGFSMGGVSTWANFENNLDIIGYFMPLSGDYWGANDANSKASKLNSVVENSGLADNQFAIFCATGDDDIAYPNVNPQIEAMKSQPHFHYTADFNEGNLYFLVAPGKTHYWGYVRHYVGLALPYFFHKDFIE